MTKKVLFIDDDDIERRGGTDILKEVFEGTNIHIVAQAPFSKLSEYAELVASNMFAAFILDQKMTTTNVANYTGAQLAEHLRAIGGDRPIFIFTNYADESFEPSEWAFESVVPKQIVLRDPFCPTALAFKARLCRQIEYSEEILSEAELKYHELIVKSASNSLSEAEEAELQRLEERRIAPVAAAEREKQQNLDIEIERLKRLLGN